MCECEGLSLDMAKKHKKKPSAGTGLHMLRCGQMSICYAVHNDLCVHDGQVPNVCGCIALSWEPARYMVDIWYQHTRVFQGHRLEAMVSRR